MTEPGRWEGPDDSAAWDALARAGLPWGVHVDKLLGELERSGLLVRRRYYVPSFDELLSVYREVSHARWRKLDGLRWVMCRETHDAMVREYADKRYTPPPTFDASFWRSPEGEAMPLAALEMGIHMVIKAARRWDDTASLLGVPIRFDPAARSPLLEVDTDATVRKWADHG